ncbi:MAG: Ig-like domain-containing protein, partial [Phototrophicaceae bacterium]
MKRNLFFSVIVSVIFALSYGINQSQAQSRLVLEDQDIDVFYTGSINFSVIPQGGVAPYSYEIIQPLNGIVDNFGGDFDYFSVGGFVGQDSFEVTVTDATDATDTAIITINVLPAEFVSDEVVNWSYNTPYSFHIFPIQGISPFVSNVEGVNNGILTETPLNTSFIYTYTPNDGFFGTETINITLTDATGISDSGIYTITIPEPNFIDPETFYSFYNNAFSFNASALDIPNNPIIDITQPTNGVVTGNLDVFTYTPNDGFFGIENFSITVTDSNGTSDTAIFDITIKEPIVLTSTSNTDLIQAIEQANANSDKDTIVLLPSTVYSFTEFYELFEEGHIALPEIDASLQIVGNNSTLIRQLNENFGFFAVNSDGLDFLIRDLSISNARADYQGGAIYYDSFDGLLDVKNVIFANNVAYYGGAIQLLNGEATIDNSQFINNRAELITISSSYGGAISAFTNEAARPSITVRNSYFDGNTSTGNNGGSRGGGIYAVSVNLIVENNIFIRNGVSQNGLGSALYIGGSSNYSIQVTNNCILDNNLSQIYTQLSNTSSNRINLSNNWWGSSRGVLPNYMDGTISTSSALTQGILGCPTPRDFYLEIPSNTSTLLELQSDGLTPINYSVDNQPTYAILSGTPPSLTILHDKNYYGSDEFSYQVQTSDNLTGTGYITLDLLPDPTAPLDITPLVINSPHQEPISFAFNIDGGVYPFTAELLNASANGITFFESNAYNPLTDMYELKWFYLPDSSFAGTEDLTFEITDSLGQVAETTVTINVGQESPPTIIVDTTDISRVDNGNCSFNDALIAARSNQAVDMCAAGRADIIDIIYVPAGVYTSGFEISSDVVIRGAGITETIFEGDDEFRVFYTANTTTVQFEHLTIRNGFGRQIGNPYRRGGGLFIDGGDTRIFDVLFFNNWGDANGGGIYLDGNDRSFGGPSYIESYNSYYVMNEAFSAGYAISTRNSVATIINNVFVDNGYGIGNDDAIHSDFNGEQVLIGTQINADFSRVYHNCFPNYDSASIRGNSDYVLERYNWYDADDGLPLPICDVVFPLRETLYINTEPLVIPFNALVNGNESETFTNLIFLDHIPNEFVSINADVGDITYDSDLNLWLWSYT